MPRSSFYDGNVASTGMTYAVPPNLGGLQTVMADSGGLGEVVKKLFERATYKPENDPKAQQARYYAAEADKTSTEAGHLRAADSVISEAAQNLLGQPGGVTPAGLQEFIGKTAPYVKDWKDYGGIIQQFISTTPGAADNPILKNALTMSLGGIDKNKDLTATDHATRVAQEAKVDRDKIEYEHRDRVLNVQTDASTAMRGQDIGASTAMRGQDVGASTAMRGQDLTDARVRNPTPITTATEKITTPASTQKHVGGFLGVAGGHDVVTPQKTITHTTRGPSAAGGSAPKTAPGTRPPLSAFAGR